MKKILSISMGALLLAASLNASAFWGNNNNGWGNGGGYNDWPVFTPMYWMEEMSDQWDDDNYGGGYGAPYGGGYGAPYGGGYGAPYGGGYAPAYPAPVQ
jgi:hypothetical protein